MSLPATEEQARTIFEGLMAKLGLEKTTRRATATTSATTGALHGLWLTTEAQFVATLVRPRFT